MSMDRVVTAPRIISCRSAPNSAPSSPKNRLKFLCSHGGRILPRPSDGHLKYVGGETRVIAVPRDIPFQELMKKLTYLIDGEMILKYQVVHEDLDALVTVKSDEDLRHMLDEIDRCESLGCPRLRAFLFPANPVVIENQMGSVDHHALEQRYIDSINGIIRSSPFPTKQYPTVSTMQRGSLVSSASACSSPRSPDSSCTTEAMSMNGESMFQMNSQTGRTGMHKVLSSPSLCSLNIPNQSCTYYVNQLHPQFHQNYRQAHQLYYHSPKLPIDSHKSRAPERLVPIRSVGQADGIRYRVDPVPQYYCSSTFKQNQGSGCCNKCMHPDDFSYRRVMGRRGSPATSSAPPSPRYGQLAMKPWD